MTASGDPAIALRDVGRTFGGITALRGVSCTVPDGGVLGLLGHTGAGKTTALRLIAGVLSPTSGSLRVLGMDPARQGAQVRRHVGVVLADPLVDRRLSGRQNLRFVARVHGLGRGEADARIDELARALHLDDRLDERTAVYSDGLRQRLSLARALLPDPRIVLLDEPTATLDAMAAHTVRQVVADVAAADGRTVVLATHDLSEAAQLCDEVAVLHHGRVLAQDGPDGLVGAVTGRGVRLVVDAEGRALVSRIATGHGYTVEPLDAATVRVHGVAYRDVPALVRELVAAEVELFGVTVDQPTLTDYYLTVQAPDVDGDGDDGDLA